VTLHLTARCVRGLEWLLAAEVAGLGADRIVLAERQVSFLAAQAQPQWLSLRTADDVLLHLGTLHGVDHTRAAVAELARQLSRIDFMAGLATVRRIRSAANAQGYEDRVTSGSIAIDVVASLLGRRNYNRFAVEDAAGDVVAKAVGARYVSRNPATEPGRNPRPAPARPEAGSHLAAESDFTVRLALSGESVDVALRLPRKPLHRRPWKLDTGPGTLHPPLAAALALIGGVSTDAHPVTPAESAALRTALDPFCGDGTVAIEAALAAPGVTVAAADLDSARLLNARANSVRAGVAARTQFARADAGRAAWRADRFDLLVTNPPWNRAVGAAGALTEGLAPFWRTAPRLLTGRGRICTVADAELDIPALLRRTGYAVTLAQSIRLAGRVSQVILATPAHAAEVALPEDLTRWRERAGKAALISDGGF
jgi:23S rRNA G2445 N2-methylase RlmL